MSPFLLTVRKTFPPPLLRMQWRPSEKCSIANTWSAKSFAYKLSFFIEIPNTFSDTEINTIESCEPINVVFLYVEDSGSSNFEMILPIKSMSNKRGVSPSTEINSLCSCIEMISSIGNRNESDLPSFWENCLTICIWELPSIKKEDLRTFNTLLNFLSKNRSVCAEVIKLTSVL